MTQNKYHVVTAEPEFTYNTLEEAEKIAKELIEEAPYKEFHLVRVIKNYKMVTNLIETDLTAPEEPLAVEPKFKVGDKVLTDDGNYGIVISLNPSVPPSANIKLIDSEKVYYYYFTGLTLAE